MVKGNMENCPDCRDGRAKGDDRSFCVCPPPWLDVKVGDKFRYLHGRDRLWMIHVRAEVDGMFVVRRWNKGKRRYDYMVERPRHFRKDVMEKVK